MPFTTALGAASREGVFNPTCTLRSRISGANFGARKLVDRPILMRRFVLGLCADLGFRAHDFAEAMRVALVEPLVVPLHALVAGGHHLPRVLFPGVERLAFFVLRQIGILGDLVRRLVVICRVLELGLLHFRPRAHGDLMKLCMHEITNLIAGATSAPVHPWSRRLPSSRRE